MFVDTFAEPTVEAHADGNSLAIHHLHKGIELFRRMFQPYFQMRMNVDGGKPGPFQNRVRHLQQRLRAEVFEQQLATFTTVERLAGRWILRERVLRTQRKRSGEKDQHHKPTHHFQIPRV